MSPPGPVQSAGPGLAVVPVAVARPPADLRLLPVALGTWTGAAVALGLPAPVGVVAVGVTWALVGLGLLRTGPGRSDARRAWRLVAVALLLGLAAGGGAAVSRVAALGSGPVPSLAADGADVTVRAVVTADPRSRPTPRGALHVVEVRVEGVEVDDHGPRVRTRTPVLVLARDPAWASLLPGQHVGADGQLRPPRDGPAPVAVLYVDDPPEAYGRPPAVQRVAGHLRAGLRDAAAGALPPDEAGLLPGLVDGDTSRLPPDVEEEFRQAGLAHLTAVSGSNVAVVVGAAVGIARLAGTRPSTTAAVGLLAVVGFAVLARPDPSVLRASVMGALGVLAVAGGRPRAAWPGLGAAVVLLVLLDPLLARSVGFALSVVATAGLLALGPPLRRALARRLPVLVADALAVALAAQAAVTPVLLLTGLPSGPVAVPANVLAAPAVPPATLVGVAVALLAPLSPAAAEVLAHLAAPPTWWLVHVARAAARAPDPSTTAVAAAVTLAALVLVLRRGSRPRLRWAAVVASAGLLVAVAVRPGGGSWAPDGWVVVACDVGQGDALVLHAGDGAGVLVDAGPSAALVDDCLADLGVDRLPLVLLTHLHADHVDGLAGALRGRGPTDVVLGPQPVGEDTAPVEQLATSLGGGRVLRAAVGSGWTVGDLVLTVLGPARAAAGTADDPNNSSLLMAADVGGLRVLLPGDLEEEGQRAALRAGHDLRADVLKVAHHGSADTDPRFVAAVQPQVALVSAGAENSYGHPRPETLRELDLVGAEVGRTDHDGDLAVVPSDRGAVLVRRQTPRA